MGASITDVAERAGVSVATVSRALRGLPNVAPQTRERVRRAAVELRYVAHPHASRLAGGKSQTIGMVVPLFTQWFFTQVVAGAEAVLAAAGYDVLLYNVGNVESRDRFVHELPFSKGVDGVIIVDLPLTDGEQHALGQPGTAVVLVGTRSTHVPSVSIDNRVATAAAVEHLADLGHERIGLIAGLPDDPLRFTAPLERRDAYRAVLAERGLPASRGLEVHGDFTYRGGAVAMAELLARENPPTAVFAESDEMAIGALRALRAAGLDVPGGVSVVGFDDHEIAEHLGLTTVAQPVHGQGEAAAALLLERLSGEADGPPPQLVLPTELRVRATTGKPPPAQAHQAARPP